MAQAMVKQESLTEQNHPNLEDCDGGVVSCLGRRTCGFCLSTLVDVLSTLLVVRWGIAVALDVGVWEIPSLMMMLLMLVVVRRGGSAIINRRHCTWRRGLERLETMLGWGRAVAVDNGRRAWSRPSGAREFMPGPPCWIFLTALWLASSCRDTLPCGRPRVYRGSCWRVGELACLTAEKVFTGLSGCSFHRERISAAASGVTFRHSARRRVAIIVRRIVGPSTLKSSRPPSRGRPLRRRV